MGIVGEARATAVRLEPPPLMRDSLIFDMLEDLGDAPKRVAKLPDHLLALECVRAQGRGDHEQGKFCKAVLDSGRVKDRKDINQ